MKEEFNRIKKASKKVIGNKHFRKVKKIKDYGERTEGLKYLVDSKLKIRLLELESKIERLDDKKKSLILEAKMHRLPGKIAIFKSTHSEKDLEVLEKLINEIERELNGPI